ncbi:uncharacterized protein [Panulirus ornatus]|uniref:uncharacterized protein isoform X3 n=2 Tax=Panulirus ornatus TaxID=150431 RepID=UPI003A86C3E9
MSQRLPDSPFRETEWDQRLDRMLDDLKTTVGNDSEMTSPEVQADSTLVTSFRSSSRNEGRSSSHPGQVEEGGHVRHTRQEYTTPDTKTHVVTEQYEYDTGDTSKAKHYQKKIMKSTYSTYNTMSAGSLEDPNPPGVKHSPPEPSPQPGTRVISASQKVANKLVDALASIGGDGTHVPAPDSSESESVQTDTMKTSLTMSSDYSTLGRLRKNINELDSLLYSLEESQREKHVTSEVQEALISQTIQIDCEATDLPAKDGTSVEVETPAEDVVPVEDMNFVDVSAVENTVFATEDVAPVEDSTFMEDISDAVPFEGEALTEDTQDVVQSVIPEPADPAVALTQATVEACSLSTSNTSHTSQVIHTKRTIESENCEASHQKVLKGDRSKDPTTTLTNGTTTASTQSNKYDGEDELIDDSKSGEVRRIVWRNRFEKTYETQDSSHPPTMSIEEESRRRHQVQHQQHQTSTSVSTTTSTLSSPKGPTSPQQNAQQAATVLLQRGPSSPRLPQLQCAVYWPGIGTVPNLSPGGQSWKEPIPLATPPQLSPREPGVAYIYTYGNTGGTGVQPLPPLNYVNVPGPQSVPPSEGAPSPTPSGQLQGQPIIYHYSYHYTIQPGQPLPEGAPPPPGGIISSSPPALQMAPATQHPPQSSHHTHIVQQSHTSTHSSHPGQSSQPSQPSQPGLPGQPGQPSQPGLPGEPSQGHPGQPGQPTQPGQLSPTGQPTLPGQPSTLINYNVHSVSSSTRSTSSTVKHDTSSVGYPGGPPGHDEPYGPQSPHSPGGPDGPLLPADDHYPSKPHGPESSNGPGSPIVPSGISSPGGPGGLSIPNGPAEPTQPGHPGHPGSISITINKTTTTHTTHSGGYPDGPNVPDGSSDVPPVTSTPYPSRGRSVSPEPHSPGSNVPQHVTYVTHVTRSSHSDSLDRVRRPKHETLPFPDTSPIRSSGDNKIPRRVDDLMNSFSDSEDGPTTPSHSPHRDPTDHEPLLPHNAQVSVRAEADAKAAAAAEAESKRELTKNKAGPPVYYPPGHELFHETMHTMTLKEGHRRGKAKWRMERASGYKESSSSSETKGGVAMVPVCLPLCCGAACVIM